MSTNSSLKMKAKNVLLTVFLISIFLTVYSSNDLEEVFRAHVRVLASDSLQGRGLGTEGTERARDYIAREFAQAGLRAMPGIEGGYLQSFSFRQRLAWIPGTNIVGYVEGSDPVLKNEYIVLGAHYDHLGFEKDNGEKTIYPGADDNASGVAAIIELGRYFAARPGLLKRSLIIVAFDAEESGLIGSRWFVDNSPVPVENIKLMFSFDMVGMYGANNGVHLRGMGSMENGVETAMHKAAKTGIALRNTGSNIERRTDTAPFGDAGIPAVHVFTGTKSPYHKPEDQYHLLDYVGMVKIHEFMTTFIPELASREQIEPAPALIAHAQVQAGKRLPRLLFGFNLNTGSGFHRYDDEFFRANSLFATSAGFYLQVPVSQLLTLQQEALFDVNGSKIEGGNFRRYSATLPLNLQLGTPRASGNPARVFVFAGPYFRYSFGGTEAGESIDFDLFEQQEWGYSYGLTLEVFMFSIGFTHRRAVTGLFNDSDINVFDSNNYFTLGYRF